MSNILIINAHHPYPFAEGKLNASLVQRASEQLQANGHQTRIVEVDKGWDVEQELAHHQWADVILLQTPVPVDEGKQVGLRGAIHLVDYKERGRPGQLLQERPVELGRAGGRLRHEQKETHQSAVVLLTKQ